MKTITKNAVSIIAAPVILTLGVIACRQNNIPPAIKGCTNKEATNYNASATQDDGSCCVPTIDVYRRDINVFELGVPVPFATFNFIQTDKTFVSGCSQNRYSTVLKIQNLTGHYLTFSYTINFSLNLIQWSSANTVTLSPGQTLEVGEINQNPGRIDFGAIGIGCYGILVY
ncbi:hypothetical protein [Mucilaginibacter ginsenosidivorans]|uniref:Uncharacterized protein n=1 Tax=Mucilaginibacter ginsenosidivorans TaxID=398053 RepID=A0A5B8UVY1_9SPHI|nr:hypothetical protein [Mucilaginibacter ginsenosidivorans]QEC62491.1 hypothetical protein FRZ54_07785 [Mucilaginibacter ginsenosidivorans]